MTRLMTMIADMANEYGFNLNESAELETDVANRLAKAGKLDEVDTVSFGLETDDGKIVKVYVAEKDADKFEEIMSKALGKVDDIEEAINMAAKDVDIIDVDWPEEDVDDGNTEVEDDGSESLDPKVYAKANANREADQLKPKMESYSSRHMNSITESAGGVGIVSRLSSPNQQLIIQAILELGIPEVALDRSPYRATIIKNIRSLALTMQNDASLKQALRLFVKRTIDYNAPEETKDTKPVNEALLLEGNADIFWTTVDSLLKLLDKSRKGLDYEKLINDGKYITLKKRSISFLNSKVGTALKTKLLNLQTALSKVKTDEAVVESLNGDDMLALITNLLTLADPTSNKMLSQSVLKSTVIKELMRRAKQSTASLPGNIKMRLDAVVAELSNVKEQKTTNGNMLTEVNDVTITGSEDGVMIKTTKSSYEFIEENLERLLKATTNRGTVNIKDTNGNTFIVSPRHRSILLKQAGMANQITLDAEQISELQDCCNL